MKHKNLWVCKQCLAAIESHEGKQVTLHHDIELEFDLEDFDKISKCDWCEQDGFSTLYELIVY